MPDKTLIVNGQEIRIERYASFHQRRLDFTLNELRKLGCKRIVEVGGHPWAMTSALVEESNLKLCATISAEEVTNWSDDIGVTRRTYELRSRNGVNATFPNYSVNIERTLFNIEENPDAVIACEIIEHLLRSPHIMLLNINHWLAVGGKLLITTPNGAQFSNPFRRKSNRPAYRCNVYGRHNYLFTLAQLVDLVELCGFKTQALGYWNVYNRSGPSSVYDLLGKLPSNYFREKFHRTLYISARKEQNVTEMSRLPICYAPSPNWEYIRQDSNNSAENMPPDEM